MNNNINTSVDLTHLIQELSNISYIIFLEYYNNYNKIHFAQVPTHDLKIQVFEALRIGHNVGVVLLSDLLEH